MIMIIRGVWYAGTGGGEGGVAEDISKSHGSCWGRVSKYCNQDWPD